VSFIIILAHSRSLYSTTWFLKYASGQTDRHAHWNTPLPCLCIDINNAVIDRRLRPRCCHLGSYFTRPKSSPVRPLACNRYYCAPFIAKPKAACELRFSWAATSSNLGLWASMTSSIKLEVRNVSLHRQTCTKNLVKIRRVVPKIWSRTDKHTHRQTDTLITILRCPVGRINNTNTLRVLTHNVDEEGSDHASNSPGTRRDAEAEVSTAVSTHTTKSEFPKLALSRHTDRNTHTFGLIEF